MAITNELSEQQRLPLNLVARCVSYNVESAADIAKLRLVSKEFGSCLKSQLTRGDQSHFLIAPPKQTDQDSYLKRLLTDYDPKNFYEDNWICVGEMFSFYSELERMHLFDDTQCRNLQLVGPISKLLDIIPEISSEDNTKDLPLHKASVSFASPKDRAQAYALACDGFLNRCWSYDDFEAQYKLAQEKGLFEPLPTSESISLPLDITDKDQTKNLQIYPILVSIQIHKNSPTIVDKITLEDKTVLLTLKAANVTFGDNIKGEELTFVPMYQNGLHHCLALYTTDDEEMDALELLASRVETAFSEQQEAGVESDEVADEEGEENNGEEEAAEGQYDQEGADESNHEVEDEGEEDGEAEADEEDQEDQEDQGNAGEADHEEAEEDFEYYQGVVLIHILATSDSCAETLDEANGEASGSNITEGFWNRFQNRVSAVEGVVVVDDAVPKGLSHALQERIQALADRQESQGQVDYHPHSGNVVRDIVHPALYSYIKGVSPVQGDPSEETPCVFPSLSMGPSSQSSEKDFWGRPYESSKYQWLPTYVNVALDGKCTFEDYINGLVPRDDELHKPIYESLSRLLEESLPYMESVYSYVHAVRPLIDGDNDEAWYEGKTPMALDQQPVTFRGQKLQVIPKIVDYELKAGETYEGVWHVEGMSHEEIVLTALYILDRDEEIEGGDLTFKRTFLKDESEHLRVYTSQSRPQGFDDLVYTGLTPLGRVETRKGRLIVFPNSHVHKVQEMVHNHLESEEDGRAAKRPTAVSRRRIIVFFLVNPLKRIMSTREIAPQQGVMSLEDAFEHRLQLMKERKYHKQNWNIREVELCEH